MSEGTNFEGAAGGTAPIPSNFEQFSPEDQVLLNRGLSFVQSWSENDDDWEYAFTETQKRAQEFTATHEDAASYALYQIFIGGTVDNLPSKVDYEDGALMQLFTQLDTDMRDRKSGNTERGQG